MIEKLNTLMTILSALGLLRDGVKITQMSQLKIVYPMEQQIN